MLALLCVSIVRNPLLCFSNHDAYLFPYFPLYSLHRSCDQKVVHPLHIAYHRVIPSFLLALTSLKVDNQRDISSTVQICRITD